jgi:hypothetical protein
MSYIGSIGILMADTGLQEVLDSTFGGLLKMLNGKKFPENVRALRIVVEEVLRPVFQKETLTCMDDLQEVHRAVAQLNFAKQCLMGHCLHQRKYSS